MTWGVHIDGAAAEMAAAKSMGVYWSGSINTFKEESDLLGNIEVKNTAYHDGYLRISKNDLDDQLCVLVTGIAARNDFIVQGWIKSGDAKKDKYRPIEGNTNTSWLVPQHDLNDMETIKDHIKWR